MCFRTDCEVSFVQMASKVTAYVHIMWGEVALPIGKDGGREREEKKDWKEEVRIQNI